MQRELGADVVIHGVNGVGHDSANDTVVDGRDLPWLQDVPEADVWKRWDIAYRDVVILDADNVVVGIYNLTDHNLADPRRYDELKAMMAP